MFALVFSSENMVYIDCNKFLALFSLKKHGCKMGPYDRYKWSYGAPREKFWFKTGPLCGGSAVPRGIEENPKFRRSYEPGVLDRGNNGTFWVRMKNLRYTSSHHHRSQKWFPPIKG